ncbi:putative phosphatidate phosphatase [Stomoxys calcitrans]|uniref:putative phosphatidate phosphatase n=1 Tax=Stomoxys calcitrans TaxID=35570 RepID=UPI0027E297C3|nr:putative phosphatidate phosphatase [Stomoxys calcitrans]
MNSLRPNSVCDTTPLQRLESQSSCSEPSSPTLNGATLAAASISAGLCGAAVATVSKKAATAGPGVASTTTTALLSPRSGGNGECDNNYLGPGAGANGLAASSGGCALSMGSGGSGISASPSTTTTASTASTTLSSLSNHNNNNNNNHKNEKSLNIFINSGVSGGHNGALVSGVGLGQKHKMELYGSRKICCRIFVDFVLLACVGLPILSFTLWGEAYKRGFFCNDDSLMHPYHESTVPSWMLYLMCFVIPISMITIVEFFKANSHKMRSFGNLSSSNYYFWHLEIPDWAIECYKRIGLLIFGSGVCELTTDIAKYSVGRLRPHFFAVCQPVLPDGSTCDNPLNEGRYIEDFTCRALNYSSKIIKEAHLSFPSGHASFTSFTMIYTAIYLQKRLTCTRSKMFKHLLQFLFLMFAWYTSLTRVSDYKHHWTDVLAGSLIGTAYAIIVTSSMW